MSKLFIALLCATCLLFSGVASGEQLAAQYYQTYAEKTEQLYPESDWAYVADVNALEPVTEVVKYVWIDYDANTLAIYIVGGIAGDSCLYVGFVDVTVVTTPEWRSAQAYYWSHIPCDVLSKQLKEGLGKEGTKI